MILFIFTAAALLLVTLFSLLRPWWRKQTAQRRVASADFPAVLNTTIHHDRLVELERDYKNGVISSAGHAQAKEELQSQLLDDIAGSEANISVIANHKPRHDGWVLAILVSVIAIGLYTLIGSPAGLTSRNAAVQYDDAQAMDKINQLIARLEEKMQKNPNNPEGWGMLARAYKLTGRLDEAERALGRVGPTLNQNASLLADLAEVLAQKNGALAGRPSELILQALQLEPDNGKVLYLAGAAAFEEGHYKVAIAHWEHLQQQVDPQSDDGRNIAAGIAKARELSDGASDRATLAGVAAVGMQSNAAMGTPQNTASGTPSAQAGAVSGRVELGPEQRAQTTADETVFIFARAVNGPRMPLAIKRVRVADLPFDFNLDDSQAMSPDNKISSAKELRIEVRISKSGQAMPASGDLTGSSAVVKPGTKGIHVVVDQRLP
ncbi:MAG TPA: c-type cytochrome biogenesis protein CcmI [Rugosibacter sp.]